MLVSLIGSDLTAPARLFFFTFSLSTLILTGIVYSMPCFNPYKNFRFRLKWDGCYFAAVSEISGLKLARAVEEPSKERDLGSFQKSPWHTKYGALQLRHGVTHDKKFVQWAQGGLNRVSTLGSKLSLNDFRKDLIIEMYNEADHLAVAFKVHKCWVSKYLAMPDPDGNANAVTIELISLENEGWERHYEVK